MSARARKDRKRKAPQRKAPQHKAQQAAPAQEPRPPEPRRPEPWAYPAYLLVVLYVGLLVYLGMRTGGDAPLAAYRFGPPVLAMSALFLLVVGVAWSVLRRPVFQRRRRGAFLCLLVVFGFVSYPIPFPTRHEGRPSTVEFRLPVEGEWTVFWGGEDRAENRLVGFSPDQRYGLHLVVTEERRTHSGSGERNEDYFCFGREVRAPAAGEVVAVEEGLPDHDPRRVPPAGTPPLGNHVVLEVAEGQYFFLAGLARDSVTVEVGDRVEPGRPLARVGHSGFSRITPEPHLSLHLQDTPVPLWGQAIPWRLSEYEADGKPVERGMPRGGIDRTGLLTGQIVQSSEP